MLPWPQWLRQAQGDLGRLVKLVKSGEYEESDKEKD